MKYKSKAFLIFETFYLIILPLLFSYFYPSFYTYRVLGMLVLLLYVFIVMKTQKISLYATGLFRKNNIAAIRSIAIPTTVLFFTIAVANTLFPSVVSFPEIKSEAGNVPLIIAILFYVLISAPIQEFIFRGFFITRLELVSKNKWFLIFYSSLVFALVHLPSQNQYVFVAAFFFSVWFAANFLKFRNILGPLLVHMILGALFIYLAYR